MNQNTNGVGREPEKLLFGRQQLLFLLVRDLYDLLSGDGTVTAWDGRAI